MGWTRVQAAEKFGNPSAVATFSATQAGNLLIAFAVCSGATPAVTDSAGQTYSSTTVRTNTPGSTKQHAFYWIPAGTVAGVTSMTLTGSANCFLTVAEYSFSGLKASYSVVQNTETAFAGTTVTSIGGSLNGAAIAGNLTLLGDAGNGSTNTFTAGTGITSIVGTGGQVNGSCACGLGENLSCAASPVVNLNTGGTANSAGGTGIAVIASFPNPVMMDPAPRTRGLWVRRALPAVKRLFPIGNLGPVQDSFAPKNADFDTRIMMKANPVRVRRGHIISPPPAATVIAPVTTPRLLRDVRPLAKQAVRRGAAFEAPKPQTVGPPPYPFKIDRKLWRAKSFRVYGRQFEATKPQTVAPPPYPYRIDRKMWRARNFRTYGKQFEAPKPQTTQPNANLWFPPNIRVRVKPPQPRWARKRFETTPPQFNPTFLPLVQREARIKPPYPRYRRTRLEFTPNDQAKAPDTNIPARAARPPSRILTRSRPKITPTLPTPYVPVERKVTARRATPISRRRALVAPPAEAQPIRVLGRRASAPAIVRKQKPTVVPAPNTFSPGGLTSVRRKVTPPPRGRSTAMPQSPGYTNPVLTPRGRTDIPFRAGAALRRGRRGNRGSWYDPIAPLFVPRWVRTRRMQGLSSVAGRGQIFAPVILTINDVVYAIRPAPDSWQFGFTVDNWQFTDDNDNWTFGFAGG